MLQDDLPQSPADDPLDRPIGHAREPFSLPARPPGQMASLEPGGEIPDWLRTGEMEKSVPSSTNQQAEDNQQAEEEVPDWLRGVPEPMLNDDALDSDAYESSDAEWLADFSALVEPDDIDSVADRPAQEPASAEDESAAAGPQEDETVPDWLAGIVGETESTPVEPAEPATDNETGAAVARQEEIPGWLAALDDEDEDDFPDAELPDDLDLAEDDLDLAENDLDWDPEIAAAALSAMAYPDDDAPDWLSGILPDEDLPAAEETPMPDWMAEYTGDTDDEDDFSDAVADMEMAADDEGTVEEDIDRTAAAVAGVIAGAAVLAGRDEDDDEADSPDWLQSFEADEDEQEPVSPASLEMPAWLAALEADDESTEGGEAGSLVFEGEDLPAWLADIQATEGGILPVDEEKLAELDTLDELFESPEAAEGELAEEVDDWFIPTETPLAEGAIALEEDDFAGDEEIDLSDVDDDNLPDWLLEPMDELAIGLTALASVDKLFDDDEESEPSAERAIADAAAAESGDMAPVRKPVTGELTNVPAQLVGADLPDWLQDNPLAVNVPEGTPAAEEVPDWLQPAGEDVFDELLALDEAEAAALASSGEWAALLEDLPTAGAHEPPDTAFPAAEGMLRSADIPEWLESMRPTETTPSGADQVQEPGPQAGPLAGFPGVILIEPSVASPRTAERPPVAFSVSPEQRQQVNLLRQLIAEEHKPPAVVTPLRVRDIPSPLRLVLGLLLLFVVIIGLFMPPPVDITPPVSPALVQVQDAVATAAGQPVLVAFEYTPGMAGEMSPQAASLLTTLAAQNSPVMVVSQSAAGLTMGENIAQEINGLNHDPGVLIPGEAVGLRQLGRCIADPAGCDTLYGQPVSDAQRDTMANLGLILVLASERDGLVSWMEQVTPQLEVPVVAGVTQALDPVARPYFQSGQVLGVIGGFPDAVAFEQEAGQDGPQSSLVWAVTLAQWIVVAALIIGNVFWVIEGNVRRDG